jgi:hypothetical protein
VFLARAARGVFGLASGRVALVRGAARLAMLMRTTLLARDGVIIRIMASCIMY